MIAQAIVMAAMVANGTLNVTGMFTLTGSNKVTFPSYDLTINTNAMTVQTVPNVVTNFVQVSEQWESLPAPTEAFSGDMINSVAYGRMVPVLDKKRITVTTTIKRIYTLTLKWKGKTRTLVHEEIVSKTVKTYRKKENWEETE